MTSSLRRGVAVAVLLGAACASLPEPGDPLAPRRDDRVGLPVLSFLWKRAVADHSSDHLPQEFAVASVDRQVSGDKVYVGSHGGVFYALRAGDGKILWRQKVGATSARPLVDRGRIYLGTDDGTLMSIDTVDGEVMWRYSTKGSILHAPAIVGDTVIFSNDSDHVFAVDRDSGKWRWQYERDTPEEFTIRGHAGVAIAGDRVYCGFADGHVVALAAASGEVVWVRSLAGESEQFLDVDTTPVVASGVLYAASTSGGLYALDVTDGTERWRLAVKGAGEVALAGGRLYVAAADEGLYALDLSGHVLWRQGLRRGGDPARPVVVGDYLFLSLSDAGLLVVDRGSGALLQQFDPGDGVSSEPTVVDDRLYVLSNGGFLYAMTVRAF